MSDIPPEESGGDPAQTATQVFTGHHELLFSVGSSPTAPASTCTPGVPATRPIRRSASGSPNGSSPPSWAVTLNALMQALAPGVTVWADGGGMARAAGTHPVHGRDKVARLIIGDAFRHPIPDLSIRYRRVNGEPAALLLSGSTPYMLVSLDLIPDGDKVRGIYVVTNPGKLSRLG